MQNIIKLYSEKPNKFKSLKKSNLHHQIIDQIIDILLIFENIFIAIK